MIERAWLASAYFPRCLGRGSLPLNLDLLACRGGITVEVGGCDRIGGWGKDLSKDEVSTSDGNGNLDKSDFGTCGYEEGTWW